MSGALVLATRASALALWQAERTRELLGHARPGTTVELLEIRSSGDADQKSALARFGRIGIFTVEVDAAVIDGRAHMGVHSMKDMTTTLQEGVQLASALERAPVEDAWVARDGVSLRDLPSGARVATGSLRRAAMVRRIRPDVEVVGIRGNVDTRLRKISEGEADATILARAGLVRLGLEHHITEVLPVDDFLPAVAQGIVGLTVRTDDEDSLKAARAIGDPDAWAAALAERALLRTLKGGCNVPAGGHARVVENTLVLRARILSTDGRECVEGELRGPADEASQLGTALAEELLGRGASRLIEAARA